MLKPRKNTSFVRFARISYDISRKILLKPEEVSKKNQSLEVKMLLKPEEVSKKTKILTTSKTLVFLVFLRPPQVLAIFSPLDFGFFETSSGFGNIFPENLAKT